MASAFDVPEADFDVVLALNVLHLVDDVPATLALLHALLRPGGVLITSTACISGGWVERLLPVAAGLGVVPAVRFMTRASFLKDMADAGFTLIDVTVPGDEASVFTVAHR